MVDYYQHSGKAPLIGWLLAAAAGVPMAIVGGVIYAFATVYIPIIYLNFLLTFIFSISIGLAVSWGAKRGHVRSPNIVGTIAGCAAIIGMYAAWGADMLARVGAENVPSVWSCFEPEELWAYVKAFYEQGQWTIGHSKEPISGIPLAIVWIIEAGGVIGFAMYWARNDLESLAYCERCGCWTRARLARLLDGTHIHALVRRVRDGDLTALTEIPAAPRDAKQQLLLETSGCQHCGESNFLTLTNVTKTVDKKGKESINKSVMVDKLVLGASDVALIEAEPPPPAPPPPEPDGPSFDFLNGQSEPPDEARA